MPDVSFERLGELAADVLARHGHYWMKFTCCGARQEVEPHDQLHESAICKECGQVYDFKANGGGMSAAFLLPRAQARGF